MEALVLDYRVWDLVSGTRVRPDPPPKARIVFGEAHENQAAIDAANDNLEDFEDAYITAACLIGVSISDPVICIVSPVLENPVRTWKVLRNLFATRSEMKAAAARMAPHHDVETKTAQQGSSSKAAFESGGASGKSSVEGFFYGSCPMFNGQDSDSHHNFVHLTTRIENNQEVVLAHSIDRSTEFMVDTGASHHIAC